MQVRIEPPGGWGPLRMLITALEQLGYRVEEVRYPGEARSELVIS